MKFNLASLSRFAAAATALSFCTVTVAAAEGSKAALMVVAHGSRDPGWNKRVIQAVEKLEWEGAKAVAFLSSHAPEHEMKNVAAQLDQPGIKKIVVVPLLVSSFSGHYEEIRYYVGVRKDLPHNEAEAGHASISPLHTKARLILTPAMDGHPLISQILADQLTPLTESGNQKRSVILVAHGPNEDAEHERWLTNLRAHAEFLRQRFGLHRAEAVTLRDDAPEEVREAATEHLRKVVREAGTDSEVLVVPVLISIGHIQKEIQRRLEGLEYKMVEGGLAYHPLAAEWIHQQATATLVADTAADCTPANLRK